MRRQHPLVASALAGAVLLTAACDSSPAAPCAVGGTGTLSFSITGLPAGVDAAVSVTGPGGTTVLTSSSTLSAMPSGTYTISSAPVSIADSLVNGYIRGTVQSNSICLRDGETRNIPVPHSAIGSAGKVWVGAQFFSLGFTSAQLGTTATIAPAVSVGTRGSVGAAFDRDGNLWVRGETASDPYLMRFPAAALGSSGNPNPDRILNISGVNCEGASALAFDESGNLWVSIGCQQRVVRLTPTQLGFTGTVSPTVQITGLVRPEGLAFDAGGNLWVADDTHLRRFNAGRLTASISGAADLRATFTTPSPPSPSSAGLSVNHLAFSPSGELWVSTYANFAVYRVEASVVAASGIQNAQVSRILYFSSFAQPRGFAFDNAGGLNIAYLGSSFARLSPAQLQTSVLLPSVVEPQRFFATGNIVTFADNVVLFPAPAGTPLYSRTR